MDLMDHWSVLWWWTSYPWINVFTFFDIILGELEGGTGNPCGLSKKCISWPCLFLFPLSMPLPFLTTMQWAVLLYHRCETMEKGDSRLKLTKPCMILDKLFSFKLTFSVVSQLRKTRICLNSLYDARTT